MRQRKLISQIIAGRGIFYPIFARLFLFQPLPDGHSLPQQFRRAGLIFVGCRHEKTDRSALSGIAVKTLRILRRQKPVD